MQLLVRYTEHWHDACKDRDLIGKYRDQQVLAEVKDNAAVAEQLTACGHDGTIKQGRQV